MKILENALLWKKAISVASAEPAVVAPSETIDIDQEQQQDAAAKEEVPVVDGDSALGKRKADEQLSAQ